MRNEKQPERFLCVFKGGGRRETVLNAMAEALRGRPHSTDTKLAELMKPAEKRQQGLEYGNGSLPPAWAESLGDEVARGLLTNSPPSTRRRQDEGAAEVDVAGEWLGGEDTLDAVLYVHWPEWESFRAKLERVKEIAKEIRDGSEHELPLINGRWVMQAEAIVTKGGGPSYRYVMRDGGITLAIANMQAPKGDCANVKVTFGSLVLMTSDLRHEWERLVDEIDTLGGVVERSKVSRVDGCADVVGVPTAEFVAKFRERHFVSRARKLTDNFQLFSLEALERQATGCILSVYAYAQGLTNDFSEVSAFAWEFVHATLARVPSGELFKRLGRKRNQQDAAIPRSGAIGLV
jgi:hypothetical protein